MRVWVVDTTPVVVLAKVGHLDLLPTLADELLLPAPVAREIRKGPADDPARLAIEAGWGGKPIEVTYIPVAVRRLGTLGAGERAALALAKKRAGSVVADDAKGRTGARKLGLPLLGTLTVLTLAKKEGHLAAVAPVIHDLLAVGHYLDEDLIRNVLALVGETWP